MPKIKTALLLDMLFILTESQGSTKGQEERDIYFGRLFGLVAIAESGILSDPTQTESEDVVLILERLIEFTRAKIYLKAPAFKAILLVLKQVQQSLMYSKVSNYAIAAALTGEDSSFGCEELWLVVCLQAREVVDAPWPTLLPDWHNGSPLHPKNLDKLVDLLKESTFLSPILHPLWEDLVSISAAPQKKSKKSISLFQLWSALDNTLFHSTHERKLLGFQLFQKILTALPTPSKSLIFTPNFLRCLMNSLASKDTYLHKAARQTATSIAKMAEQAPEAALDMALQLIGPHGSLNFDSLSKTKTVETILHQLSTVDIQRYIEHLKGLFLTLEKGEKMEEYTKSAEVLRTRVLAQMVMLFKIPKVPKEEAWITDVLKFLCLQGFFVAEDGSTKFQIPKPLLSSKTQKDCQDRLQSILGCLLSTALAGQDARKTQSLTSKGEHWSRAVLEIIEDLLKVDELSLAQSMDEDLMQLIVRGSNLITEIRKKEKKVQKSEAVNALFLSQLTAFEHLVTHIVIQAYSDPREISGLVEDLEECFKKIWESGSGKTKKRKADSSEEEPAPIDVLIDILLSLLSKPSAPLRNLAVQTFKSFTCQMTEASFDVIFEVLTADNSGKGELFEEEDDEDMAEEDSDEESDDDSSDEDSADDDEATEAKADVPDLLITSPPPADVEDDVLGDADMEAYDSKLAEIFKQKAQLKTAKKDLKQQTLHFKFRVIDLLEAFIQKQAQSPLIIKVQSRLLNLVFKAAVDAQIHDRLVALIKNKIFKSKDVPKPESLDIEQVYSDMEEIHQMARKAKDSVFVNLCSFASLYMARILGAAQAIETPSKKKVKVAEDAKTDSAPQFSRISQIYIKSLEDFMTKNKSKVKPSLFLELFSRYNRYSWEILPSLVNMMSHESKPKAYSLIQGYAMVAKMLKQNQRAVRVFESQFLTGR